MNLSDNLSNLKQNVNKLTEELIPHGQKLTKQQIQRLKCDISLMNTMISGWRKRLDTKGNYHNENPNWQ